MLGPFAFISDDLSLEEKVKLLKQNNSQAVLVRREIQKLKTSTSSIKEKATSEIMPLVIGTDKKTEESGIKDIYNQVCLLSSEDQKVFFNEIRDLFLSSKYSFTYLADAIKIRLYQDIITYTNLALEDGANIGEARELIADLKRKLSLLNEIEEKEEILEIAVSDNHLFFLESDIGNVVVLESFRKNIPLEYYSDFKDLLKSIQNGQFKGLKKLENQFWEVKDFKIRIIFGILSQGNYVILDAFMKKEDTSGYYKNFLNHRYHQFLRIKSSYLSQMEHTDFQLRHEQYLNDIYDYLDKELNVGGVKR